MQNRVFVTHIVPKDKIEKLNTSQAGNYFSYNLIGGGFFQNIFSLVPTNLNISKCENYNTNNIRFIHFRKLPNNSVFKFFNLVIENIILISLVKKSKTESVWFYNLTVHSLLTFIYLHFCCKKIKLNIILLDFTPYKFKFSLQGLISIMIRKSNGIISLTKNTLLEGTNFEIIPGIVPDVKGERLIDFNLNFLMSGILSVKRNPQFILELFAKLPSCKLYITGIFNDKKLLNSYLSKYSNIEFLGLVSYDEYINLMNKCTFCINSRDPDFPENAYNFPSKVIEYLQHNRIVISTMKYKELNDIDYIYLDSKQPFITNTFEKMLGDSNFLSKYANQSQKVCTQFGYKKWLEIINTVENEKKNN